MMVTIRGLPLKTKYQDVKVMLEDKCKITEFILDHLVIDESALSKKVRVGLVEDSDGYEIIKCLNGLRMPGNSILRVEAVGKQPPLNQQHNSHYEPKSTPSYTSEYRNTYSNQQSNEFRGRTHAPGFEGSYTAQESQFSGATQSIPTQGSSGSHGPVLSHATVDSLGRPSPWVSNNASANQWNQGQPMSSQISYQQSGNSSYTQEFTSSSQRPSTGPYPQGRGQHEQGYGYSAKTNTHEIGGTRKADTRPHVITNVELVDTLPTNPPVQGGRYPPGQSFQQQQKPITIMKENFQGPATYDTRSGNPPPSSYQRQGQGSPQSWAQQGQQLKPQSFKSNSGPYEKPYEEIRQHGMPKRADIQKNVQPPMRTDAYKDLEKPGHRFSPHRPIASSGRPFSPTRRLISPSGRRSSASRQVGPARAGSPSSNTLPQGRRISPSGRHVSPTRRLISPADRMMSTMDRRPGGPPPEVSQRRHLSPNERSARGNIPRYSPPRRYPDKPIDKNIDTEALKSTKHIRPAYEAHAQGPNKPMFSSGYRPSVHDNARFPRNSRQLEHDVPWQQEGDEMYATMKKPDEDGIGTSRRNTYGDSPRKSRSPIRRDRSPIRERYRKHSQSSPSPRRSWAFEKRRSPEAREAPPPPNWPVQNIRDDARFKTVSDRKEVIPKHVPNWDKHPFSKVDDSKRQNEKSAGPSKVFRGDFPNKIGISDDEPFTKQHQRDPKFGARNEFRNRGGYRETTDVEHRPYLNKQDLDYHHSVEHENTRRLDESRRKGSPRRGEGKNSDFKTLDKDIENIYKRAQEFKKKAEELRKSERRMNDLSEERGRTARDMDKNEFRVQRTAPTHRIDDTSRRYMDDSPRRRLNDSPRRRMDDSPRRHLGGSSQHRLESPPRRRLDGSPKRRVDGSPRRRIDGSPRRRSVDSPRRRIDGSPRRRIDGSPRRRIDGSPRRRIEGSPRRRIDGSPRRRIDGSPRRHVDGSPRRHVDGSPRRHVDGSPRRCVDESPRRCVDESPRRRMDDSPRRRTDDSPRRRLNDSPRHQSRSNTEHQHRNELDTKDGDSSREPIWKAVDKTRKFFTGLPSYIKTKREKAADEIANKLMSGRPIVDELNSQARFRVIEELKKTISHKLTELFDIQDVSFIELVIKFQSRVSDQEKDKIFDDVIKSLPGKLRYRKPMVSDSTNVPHKKLKLTIGHKIKEESPGVPKRKLKRSPERNIAEKSSDVPQKKSKPTPENKSKEDATVPQRIQGGVYKRTKQPVSAQKVIRTREQKILRTQKEMEKHKDFKKSAMTRKIFKKDMPSKDFVEMLERRKNEEPKSRPFPPAGDPVKLDALTTQIVESELQDIMIKVWQQLPDKPIDQAEILVVDMLRNNTGDSLRNVLGLNVSKRLLNVFNPLYVKLDFSALPKREDLIKLMRKYNFRGLKRIQRTPIIFGAYVNTIADFDVICAEKLIRCGPVKVAVIPVYKFDKCPKNLITNFDDKDITDDDISDINKIMNSGPTNETKILEKVKESKEDIKIEKEESPKAKKTIEDNKQKQLKPDNEKKLDNIQTSNKISDGKQQSKDVRPVKKVTNKTRITEETKGGMKKKIEKTEPHKLKDSSTIKNVFIEGNDFDELDDDTILALMSEGVVVDECSGSE